MLGLLTLGHSPRKDLEAPFRQLLPKLPLIMQGGLDRLSSGVIQSMSEAAGEYPLHVISQSGPLVIQRGALIKHLTYNSTLLAEAGAQLIVLLCTGDFPPIESPVPVLHPGHLLEGAVRSIAWSGKLGVVIPAESQRSSAERRWSKAGFEPVIVLSSDKSELTETIDELQWAGVEQVVLDCISFGPLLQKQLAQALGIPVWLPSHLTARAAAALL